MKFSLSRPFFSGSSPTFARADKKSSKAKKDKKREKERKKRLKKGAAADVSLTFPLVNMLPRRFMLEVKRKRIARIFAAVYGVILLAAGGIFFSNYTDISIASNQLSSAEQRLTAMTSNYSSSAPTLAFVQDLRANGNLVNSLYSRQIDFASVLSALTSAAPPGVTIANAAIAAGGSEEVQCAMNVADPFADATQQAPNTGCVVFSGTAGTVAATSQLSRVLQENPNFSVVTVSPGDANSDNIIPFQGTITLAPTVSLSGQTLIDVSVLPSLNANTGLTAETAAQPAPQTGDAQPVTDSPEEVTP